MDSHPECSKDHEMGRLVASVEHLAAEVIGVRSEMAEIRRKVDRGGGFLLGLLISAGGMGATIGATFTNIFHK